MTAQTRELLADTMVRDWVQTWDASGHRFTGTAAEWLADFAARTGVALSAPKLVMDDGDWTIRATPPGGGVVTVAGAI